MNKAQFREAKKEFESVLKELLPGQKIIQLTLGHGIESQKTLARLLGLKQARTSKIINGIHPITIDVAIRLASLFPEYTAAQWMEFQANYDLACAKIAGLETKLKREVRKQKEIYMKTSVSIVTGK